MLPAKFPGHTFVLVCLVCCIGKFCSTAQATVVTLNALTQGRLRSDGMQAGGSYNTSTAYSAPYRYNSYFVFDLAALPLGTVDSATLSLQLEAFVYADINQPANPPLTFDIFDVSTPVSVLTPSYSPGDVTGIAVHNDLGSGNIYATRTVTPANVGTVLTIPLSGQVLADIQAGLTNTFAVGLRLQGPDTDTHILRFGDTIDVNAPAYHLVQLQFNLTPLPLEPDPEPEDPPLVAYPEPGSMVACIGLLLLLRRRAKTRLATC